MNGKILKVSMAIALLAGVSACDEGANNDLQCDESFKAGCLDSSSYMVCRDGLLQVVQCPSGTCTEKKSTDATGAEVVEVSCGNSSTRECTTNEDCKDPAKPVCNASGVCEAESTPDLCAGKAEGDACDTGKTCQTKSGKLVCRLTPVDPCADVTCTEGVCDRGVCVTEEMKQIKNGDSCDDSLVEFCQGSSMVYCSASGKAVVTDCSNQGGCSMVKLEDENGVYLSAWCTGPEEQCETEEQEIGFCTSEEYSGKTYFFESAYECILNTEGTFTAMDLSLFGDDYIAMCDEACNATMTACKLEPCTTEGEVIKACGVDTYGYNVARVKTCTKQDDGSLGYVVTSNDCNSDCKDGACVPYFPEEGSSCDAKTYQMSCKGENNDVVAYCDSGKVAAFKCSDSVACLSSDNGYANCYGEDEELCDTIGDVSPRCDSTLFGAYSYRMVCAQMSDGTKRYAEEGSPVTYCAVDCNVAGDACLIVADADDNTKCSAEAEEYCIEAYQTSSCALIKGELTCYDDECTEAEKGNVTNAVCGSFLNLEYSEYSICRKSDDGKFVVADQFDLCDTSCDTTTNLCEKIHETEGEKCDASYVPSCDGAIALNCDAEDGIVVADDCTGYACGVFSKDGNFATCYATDDDNACSKDAEGNLAFMCDDEGDSLKFECLPLTDASGDYWVYTSYETCDTCDEVSGLCSK